MAAMSCHELRMIPIFAVNRSTVVKLGTAVASIIWEELPVYRRRYPRPGWQREVEALEAVVAGLAYMRRCCA